MPRNYQEPAHTWDDAERARLEPLVREDYDRCCWFPRGTEPGQFSVAINSRWQLGLQEEAKRLKRLRRLLTFRQHFQNDVLHLYKHACAFISPLADIDMCPRAQRFKCDCTS